MEERQSERILRIGFSGASENNQLFREQIDEFKYVNALDLATSLRAFQRAVYGAIRFQIDPERIPQLTTEQRRFYALIVTGYEVSSFYSILTTENITAAATVWQATMLTIQVMNQISESKARESNPKLGNLILPPLATLVRLVIRNGRQFRAECDDGIHPPVSYKTTDEGNREVLMAAQNKSAIGSQIYDIDSMRQLSSPYVYAYPDGLILTIDMSKRELVVKFRDYTDPIPCYYNPTSLNNLLVARMTAGDLIIVYGQPRREPWDRPDSPPRAIDVTDISSNRGPRLIE